MIRLGLCLTWGPEICRLVVILFVLLPEREGNWTLGFFLLSLCPSSDSCCLLWADRCRSVLKITTWWLWVGLSQKGDFGRSGMICWSSCCLFQRGRCASCETCLFWCSCGAAIGSVGLGRFVALNWLSGAFLSLINIFNGIDCLSMNQKEGKESKVNHWNSLNSSAVVRGLLTNLFFLFQFIRLLWVSSRVFWVLQAWGGREVCI